MTTPTPIIPEGCELCPNRKPSRDFLDVTKRGLLALILTGMLPFCFLEMAEDKLKIKDVPNTPLLMILLPAIGIALGIDINPND